MTVSERVRRTQRSLEIVIGSSIIFWTGAALFSVLVTRYGDQCDRRTPRRNSFHVLIPAVGSTVSNRAHYSS